MCKENGDKSNPNVYIQSLEEDVNHLYILNY